MYLTEAEVIANIEEAAMTVCLLTHIQSHAVTANDTPTSLHTRHVKNKICTELYRATVIIIVHSSGERGAAKSFIQTSFSIRKLRSP